MARVRYIIIGAGAVGGTIGGCLFQAGHNVVLVARGAHLEALRARGLRLVTPLGPSMLRIPAVGGPAEVGLRPGDTLILTAKTQDAAALLDEWAWQPVSGGTVAAETLPVVCAQNGVASERFALRRFRHVYSMHVWLPATHLEPGEVASQGVPLAGLLHIGRYPSGADATSERGRAPRQHPHRAGQRLGARGRLVVAEPDPADRDDRGELPEWRDRAARPGSSPPRESRRARRHPGPFRINRFLSFKTHRSLDAAACLRKALLRVSGRTLGGNGECRRIAGFRVDA